MGEIGYWFVSHCSKDIKIVEQIVDVLRECAIPYWKAPEMIPAGSNYAKEIPQALKNCGVVLFIVSEAAQNSIWVEKELDSAVNARKKIIPVRIDDTPLNDMYLFYMNNIQMIDIQIQADGRISKDSLELLHTKFKENIPEKSGVRNTTQENVNYNSSIAGIDNKFITEKPNIENVIEKSKFDARTNALRINKIPIFCKQCGMKLEFADVGTYRCLACNIEYYDDFQKIRNFIRDNGPAPALAIVRGTGVSKQTVEYFFKDDVKILQEELNFAPRPEMQSRRPMAKGSEGKWYSNIWKR